MRKGIYIFSILLLALSCFWFFMRKNYESPTPETVVQAQNTELSLQESSNIVHEDYQVQRDQVNLAGVITADANYKQEKRPLLVIAHGFNNTLENYVDYAEELARQGYLVYRFDFYGGSRASKSGGTDMLNMSVLTEKADLEAVVEQLSKEKFVQGDQVTLIGASQGGVVAALYAAEHADRINKLALVFPAFVLFDDVEATYASLGVKSPKDLPDVITHRNAQLGSIYLKDAMSVDIQQEMKKVTAPVMLIHGTLDDVVPYSYSLEALKVFPNSQLVTVEGGGHWIDAQFNQVALPALEEFLRE